MKHALAILSISLFAATAHAASPTLPRPDHIVVVFEENKLPTDLTAAAAPYINNVLKPGGSTLNLYAFHHPSQPNYYEFFAGTNVLDIGTICNDNCPAKQSTTTNNLYRALRTNPSLTFTGFADSLPAGMTPAQILTACQTSCSSPPCYQCYFALKHTPWITFAEIPANATQPFTAFPTDFTKLPTIAFVTPNLIDDMHSQQTSKNCQLGKHNNIPAEVSQGDTWLKNNLAAYATWAQTHNSLLIVTWDESSDEPAHQTCQRYQPPNNHIATFVIGQSVKPGYTSTAQYNHWDLLNTILTMYGLPAVNNSAGAKVIGDIWK